MILLASHLQQTKPYRVYRSPRWRLHELTAYHICRAVEYVHCSSCSSQPIPSDLTSASSTNYRSHIHLVKKIQRSNGTKIRRSVSSFPFRNPSNGYIGSGRRLEATGKGSFIFHLPTEISRGSKNRCLIDRGADRLMMIDD